MDAKRERELAELKEEITEAKKKEATALQLVGMNHPAYVIAAQRLNELEKQKTCLIEQQGESHMWKPCHAWLSHNLGNLGPLLLRQSNKSHAYPSRQCIAMSHFIFF